MRVSHINDIAYVGSRLVAALNEAGVTASLHDPWRPAAGVPYPWKAPFLPLRLSSVIATAAAVRVGHPDLVHVHYARLGWAGPLTGRPFLIHCHGTDVRGVMPGSMWGREIAPWLRRAAAVLFSTPDLEPWVRAYRRDARFVPNPIPIRTPRLASSQVPKADLLVGVRLDTIKGIDAIGATLAGVLALRPSTTVTIVDHGGRVSEVAAVAGEAARVVPRLAADEMTELYAAHRAAVGQMGVGALGNYELEAMGAGLAVAANFRLPSAYDVPPPLVDADSPQAIARQMSELLDDEPARAAIGAQGRAWVLAHHGPAAVALQVKAIYEEILAR